MQMKFPVISFQSPVKIKKLLAASRQLFVKNKNLSPQTILCRDEACLVRFPVAEINLRPYTYPRFFVGTRYISSVLNGLSNYFNQYTNSIFSSPFSGLGTLAAG